MGIGSTADLLGAIQETTSRPIQARTMPYCAEASAFVAVERPDRTHLRIQNRLSQNHPMAEAPGALLTLLSEVRARSTGIGSHIHGERHWRTVGANGLWLAKPLAGADIHVIFLFALLHDSMRESDGRDPEHGPRAATLAAELHAEGLLATTAAQLETLRYACFEHTNGLVSGE